MLKSLLTQFAATLFLGPLGLVYSSMATAVFFTLLLAVMFFSELGIYSVLLIWPISIVTGLLMVKFHNDNVRQSGTRLLLGPDEEPSRLTAIGSWVRGFAVLSLIAVSGYIVYLYLPEIRGNEPDQIVDSGIAVPVVTSNLADPLDSQNANSVTPIQVDQNSAGSSGTENRTDGGFAVVALPKREITPVVIDAKSDDVVSNSDAGIVTNQATLLVREAVVNLRQGPGTTFAIVTQVERGELLIEFARDGQWVNVEAAATGATGWIYGRLVSPVSR